MFATTNKASALEWTLFEKCPVSSIIFCCITILTWYGYYHDNKPQHVFLSHVNVCASSMPWGSYKCMFYFYIRLSLLVFASLKVAGHFRDDW